MSDHRRFGSVEKRSNGRLGRGGKDAFQSVTEILNASYSTVMYTGALGTAMIPKVSSTNTVWARIEKNSEKTAIQSFTFPRARE